MGWRGFILPYHYYVTIIVGLRHEAGILLAGDSAGIDTGLQQMHRADLKVFRNRGLVMGITGRFKIAQVLAQHPHFTRPPTSGIEHWIATDFIPQAYAAFDNARWRPKNGGLLVAFGTWLFQVMFEDWQYCLSADGYDAIGSGRDLALGSLHTSKDHLSSSPAERIWSALEAATHHNAGVAPPYVIYNTAAPWCPSTWQNRQEFVKAYESGVGTPAKWAMRTPPPSLWDQAPQG
jgi:hypothetical protein